MIPAGHQITWAEFKQAFKEHHIPKGLMDRKMKELLALKQGSNTVLVGRARNSVSSRKVLRVFPSHLQLDTGG
jgi:hypothetical protein